jgi:hypothetical protein
VNIPKFAWRLGKTTKVDAPAEITTDYHPHRSQNTVVTPICSVYKWLDYSSIKYLPAFDTTVAISGTQVVIEI